LWIARFRSEKREDEELTGAAARLYGCLLAISSDVSHILHGSRPALS